MKLICKKSYDLIFIKREYYNLICKVDKNNKYINKTRKQIHFFFSFTKPVFSKDKSILCIDLNQSIDAKFL